MEMTAEEIRSSYRRAGKDPAQIKVLAELNLCTEDEVRAVLGLPSKGEVFFLCTNCESLMHEAGVSVRASTAEFRSDRCTNCGKHRAGYDNVKAPQPRKRRR